MDPNFSLLVHYEFEKFTKNLSFPIYKANNFKFLVNALCIIKKKNYCICNNENKDHQINKKKQYFFLLLLKIIKISTIALFIIKFILIEKILERLLKKLTRKYIFI